MGGHSRESMNKELMSQGSDDYKLCSHSYSDVREALVGVNSLVKQNYLPRTS